MSAERPVLYVCREDGDLVMACGANNHEQSPDHWKVIHPRHVLERDRSVGLVTDLTDGQQAERASIDRPWERGPLTD